MNKPNSINDITMEYILEYVKAKGGEDIMWLKSLSAIQKPNKKGEMKRISFIEIRNNFALRYFPEIMPQKKQKKTMYDLIAEL